jgi:hypothetical protein
MIPSTGRLNGLNITSGGTLNYFKFIDGWLAGWMDGRQVKVKDKVVPQRFLTKHRAMKAYWGVGHSSTHS